MLDNTQFTSITKASGSWINDPYKTISNENDYDGEYYAYYD